MPARAARAGSQQERTGTPSAGPRSTSSCCCRCRSRPRGWPRCAAGRWTGSRCRRRTRSRSSRAAGSQITMNSYPHNWTHTLRLDKEPWSNKLVRKAANYADRPGRHLQEPAERHVHPGHRRRLQGPSVVRQAEGDLRVQPGQGQGAAAPGRLRRRASIPAKAVQLISTSGSGQMLPLAMNELIQKNLKDVGIDVDLQPVEWNTLLTRWRAGFKTPENEGLNAWNISWNFLEPWSGFGRFFHSKSVVPVSVNTMPYINPEADKLIDEAERTFDVAKQNEILARLHEVVVDDAPWIFVVHDQNPRALSPKVKGFVQPQSWFVDLTAVTREVAPPRVGLRRPASPARDPDAARGQHHRVRDGAPGPGRPDRGGDAGRGQPGRDRGHQAGVRLRQAAAGAVPRLARAGGPGRSRQVDRHPPARDPRRPRRARQQPRAGPVVLAARLRARAWRSGCSPPSVRAGCSTSSRAASRWSACRCRTTGPGSSSSSSSRCSSTGCRPWAPRTIAGIWEYLRHMVLPTVALALIPLGVITRVVRSAALDILNQEFVLALRAKGLASRRVFTHVVKNSAPADPHRARACSSASSSAARCWWRPSSPGPAPAIC